MYLPLWPTDTAFCLFVCLGVVVVVVEIKILLPERPACWDYQHEPLYLAPPLLFYLLDLFVEMKK